MKFYCISSKHDDKPENSKLLKEACSELDLDFFLITENTTLPSEDELNHPYILYRCVNKQRAPFAREVEKKLLSINAISLYSIWQRGLLSSDNSFEIHEKFQVPIVPNIWPIPDSVDDLSEAIRSIGGFPVIVKVSGGSRGIGVIKGESLESVLSIISFLQANNYSFVIKQFIDVGKPTHSYRAVILGDQCQLIYKNQSHSNTDFRSNVDQNQRTRQLVKLDEKFKTQLVKSVSVLGLEFGAVDFLLKDNQIFILEVNFPFNFSPIVKDFGIEIHKMMVEFLQKKI